MALYFCLIFRSMCTTGSNSGKFSILLLFYLDSVTLIIEYQSRIILFIMDLYEWLIFFFVSSYGWYFTFVQGFVYLFLLYLQGFTPKQMVNPWKTYVKLSAVLMGSHGLTKGSLAFLNYPAQLMFKSTKVTSKSHVQFIYLEIRIFFSSVF